MSEMTKTVLIKGDDGPVRIDEADYDKDKHTLASKKERDAAEGVTPAQVGTVSKTPTGDEIAPSSPTINDERNLHPNAHSVDDDDAVEGDGERRVVLSEPVEPAGSDDVRQVAKIGSKWFVVNGEGQKVEAEGVESGGYKNEADAWKAANPAVA